MWGAAVVISSSMLSSSNGPLRFSASFRWNRYFSRGFVLMIFPQSGDAVLLVDTLLARWRKEAEEWLWKPSHRSHDARTNFRLRTVPATRLTPTTVGGLARVVRRCRES